MRSSGTTRISLAQDRGQRPLILRHDLLLKFSKGKQYLHNEITEKVKVQKMQPVTKKVDGERVWLKNDDGSLMYAEGSKERPIGDVWTIPIINPVAVYESLNYPTQKPEKLIEKRRKLFLEPTKETWWPTFLCAAGDAGFDPPQSPRQRGEERRQASQWGKELLHASRRWGELLPPR